jgi:RNA polymerase sigma-70 factor, ECF subfamily
MAKEEIDMLGQQRKEVINEICQNTWKELYRYVYYRVQNREEAEDITQETYEKVLNLINKRDIVILEYNSYLKAIALNIIRDRWRIRQRKGRNVNIEDIGQEELLVEDFSESVANQLLIKKVMESLTEEQQRVIQLRIMEGFSVADTAKLMNRKEVTVRVLQYRAIKALTKVFKVLDQKEELL